MSPKSSSDVPETSSTTPDGPLPVSRKRKRNVLSCLDCRRRKVRCDHGLPACTRCTQRGVASSCTYEYSPGDEYGSQGDNATENVLLTKEPPEPIIPDKPKAPMAMLSQLAPTPAYLEQKDTIAHLENRLKILEGMVAHGNSAPSIAAVSDLHGAIPRQPEANFFKGRGFRTQFYGASCPNSVLASVCHRRLFMPSVY
jgi:Fungal Zn(2)-Cys(6) binuclear cluster domain